MPRGANCVAPTPTKWPSPHQVIMAESKSWVPCPVTVYNTTRNPSDSRHQHRPTVKYFTDTLYLFDLMDPTGQSQWQFFRRLCDGIAPTDTYDHVGSIVYLLRKTFINSNNSDLFTDLKWATEVLDRFGRDMVPPTTSTQRRPPKFPYPTPEESEVAGELLLRFFFFRQTPSSNLEAIPGEVARYLVHKAHQTCNEDAERKKRARGGRKMPVEEFQRLALEEVNSNRVQQQLQKPNQILMSSEAKLIGLQKQSQQVNQLSTLPKAMTISVPQKPGQHQVTILIYKFQKAGGIYQTRTIGIAYPVTYSEMQAKLRVDPGTPLKMGILGKPNGYSGKGFWEFLRPGYEATCLSVIEDDFGWEALVGSWIELQESSGSGRGLEMHMGCTMVPPEELNF
ncbi:hypothetical protein BGX38DRAFT_1263595 [Terfezia claveryi]|nr:hypothetical protein BGX38DRAFT_1263595 [Terfezia claveryi]